MLVIGGSLRAGNRTEREANCRAPGELTDAGDGSKSAYWLREGREDIADRVSRGHQSAPSGAKARLPDGSPIRPVGAAGRDDASSGRVVRICLTANRGRHAALLTVLSVPAGSTDIIGFLGLNHLFTAHITGNLVILAAHIIDGGEAQIAQMLSVPIFIASLSLTVVLAHYLESIGRSSLRLLLLLQFLLLAGF